MANLRCAAGFGDKLNLWCGDNTDHKLNFYFENYIA
jgi:hypothetical protein